MLAALGFKRKTRIFVAGSQIYGGRSRMIALTSLYPKLVTKENLLTTAELEPFRNFKSQVIKCLNIITCLYHSFISYECVDVNCFPLHSIVLIVDL